MISECLVFLGGERKKTRRGGSVGAMNFFKLFFRTPRKLWPGVLADTLPPPPRPSLDPQSPPCCLSPTPSPFRGACWPGRAPQASRPSRAALRGPSTPRRGNAPPGAGGVTWSGESHGDNMEGGEWEEEEGRNHMEQKGGRRRGESEPGEQGKERGAGRSGALGRVR